ncbi:MAG TPA: aldo/keto reductase [Candidatus Aminicenantes bacterium]|nr:aldo/keto reductase [Candidatus Aminicenantes bacterium]
MAERGRQEPRRTARLLPDAIEALRMGMGGIPIQRLGTGDADRVLEKAVDSGINFFDTARGYTDSESKFGRVLSRLRQKVLIASKSFSRGAAEMRRDIETTLGNLRSDYVDLYQCHNVASEADLERILAPDGAVAGMVRAREQGKVRFIGISGHKPRILVQALERFPFAAVQVPANFMETDAMAELIPAARRCGAGVIAMKPVGGGNIRETALNFRFIFVNGVDVAIPGMDTEAQVAANVAALDDLSPLNEAETARLQAEKERLGERFCRRCEYCMPCPQGLPISFLHVLRNYYFVYDLKEWALERLAGLARTYRDCAACGECVAKCPYHLDMPAIFRETWEKIQADRRPGAAQD